MCPQMELNSRRRHQRLDLQRTYSNTPHFLCNKTSFNLSPRLPVWKWTVGSEYMSVICGQSSVIWCQFEEGEAKTYFTMMEVLYIEISLFQKMYLRKWCPSVKWVKWENKTSEIRSVQNLLNMSHFLCSKTSLNRSPRLPVLLRVEVSFILFWDPVPSYQCYK